MSVAQTIDQVRVIPLGTILRHVGLTPRREGTTTRYKNNQFNIVVSPNNLWFDNAAAVGGRGAIDLALHLKCRVAPRRASHVHLREALDWLTDLRPLNLLPAAAPPPEPPRQSFEDQSARLALRDDARWPLARHYLTHTRCLPAKLVDQLRERGDLYPSFSITRPEVTGVCFIHRDLEGVAQGATIRNVVSTPSSCFSLGEKRAAWFTLGHPRTATQAVLVESPIDAISLAVLKQPKDAAILSMSCAHALEPALAATHQRRWALTVAFHNDRAGETGWNRCLENQQVLYPNDSQPSRMTPALKDWNKDLCAAPRRSHGRHP